jgi:hypothetical protein
LTCFEQGKVVLEKESWNDWVMALAALVGGLSIPWNIYWFFFVG